MMRTLPVFTGAILALLLSSGCDQQTPSRDHIPILKQRLVQLQEAIRVRDRAAIDSLLSVKILSHKQDSDSLLRLVYGEEGSFAFVQLALGEISYTNDRARIDCYVVDTSGRRDRPITLTYTHEHDLWLLKRFEIGRAEAVVHEPLDSTDTGRGR